MQARDQIHQYLQELALYLARLPVAEASEVLQEIESHLFDVLEQQGDSPEQVAAVLRGFGEPRQLAAQYVAHLTTGAPPPAGFRAIARVRRTVSQGLYLMMATLGFSVTLALAFIAGAKLVLPAPVGLWSVADGNAFALGMLRTLLPADQELLGMALVPLMAVLAVLAGITTRRVLRALRTLM